MSLLLLLAGCGGSGPAPKPNDAARTPRMQASATPPRIAFVDTGDSKFDASLGPCAFDAWSEDPDPAGLNVRAAPRADAPVVGKLPPPYSDEDRAWKTEFTVVESRDGWFRITHAADYRVGPESRSATRELGVTGWVHGSKIDFALQTEAAFAEPDPASAIVASDWREKGPDGAYHSFSYRLPMACQGHWVKLRVTGHDGVERDGWARGVCGIQETTCDGGMHGARGDMIKPETLPVY